MRGKTLVRMLALLSCAGGVAAAQPITVLAKWAVPVASAASAATHELTLHAYLFAGTSWKVDDVIAALPRAAALLAHCGIVMRSADLTLLDAPRPYHYYATAVSRAFASAYRMTVPALVFVEDTRNDPAYDAEAIGVSNSQRRPELTNTIWIAHGASDLPQVIAHELIHLLADSGEHSAEPFNLMRDETSPRNVNLTSAQCERIRSVGAQGGLLTRLP